MKQVYNDLYRHSGYVEPIDLLFNQYLLLTKEPVLVHTGSAQYTKELIPQLKKALNENGLCYVFVSHFESDECGGLTEILAAYPDAKVLCSEVTARQFEGFGIKINSFAQKNGDVLAVGDGELMFIDYPSEMHLWSGLLLFEKSRGIFFSSDLVFRFGKTEDDYITGDWEKEVSGITHEQIPDIEKRAALQKNLKNLPVKFIATGHGPCFKI